MGLSKELQIGKAGEHLVCFDLLSRGFNAFLTDPGLAYDIIVDLDSCIKRIQVKTATKLFSYKAKNPSSSIDSVYRFSMKTGKHKQIMADNIDFYAFVALPEKKIAYFTKPQMITRGGAIKTMLEFRTRSIDYEQFRLPTCRTSSSRRIYIDDFSQFVCHP